MGHLTTRVNQQGDVKYAWNDADVEEWRARLGDDGKVTLTISFKEGTKPHWDLTTEG